MKDCGFVHVVYVANIINNKTKVLSVWLWKTFGLTKVPITGTEDSTQLKKNWFKTFLTPMAGSDHQEG